MKQKLKRAGIAIALMMLLLLLTGLSVSAETEGDFTYTVSDGNAVITGYSPTESEEVVIPETLGGHLVTEIRAGAFYSCSRIMSLTIPTSIKQIDRAAFPVNCYIKDVYYQGTRLQWRQSGIGTLSTVNGVSLYYTKHYSDDVETKNLSWSISPIGVLTITGQGDIGSWADSSGKMPWSGRKKEITKVIIGEGITATGNSSFTQCPNLTEVQFPESLRYIEDRVFEHCSKLRTVNIPENVIFIGTGAFRQCSFEKAELPEGLLYLGSSSFSECKNLKSVTIPKGVTQIDLSVFDNCANLSSVSLHENITSIGDHAFENCAFEKIELPKNLLSIRYSAFSNCKNLKSITIPSGVTDIGMFAFSNCTNLKDIYYAGSEDEWNKIIIGSYAYEQDVTVHFAGESSGGITWNFDGVNTLTISGTGNLDIKTGTLPLWNEYINQIEKVIIEDGITAIGCDVFTDHNNLKVISIPKSVSEIADYTSIRCAALTTIDVAEDNLVYSSKDGVLYNKDKTKLISYPGGKADEVFAVPDGVTIIAPHAFEGCGFMRKLILSASVADIGNSEQEPTAFPQGLTGMKALEEIAVDGENTSFRSIDGVLFGLKDNTITTLISSFGKQFKGLYIIPEGVEYICNHAFGENVCESVLLPSTLKSIGMAALGVPPTTAEKSICYNGTSADLSKIDGIDMYNYICPLKGEDWAISLDGVLELFGEGKANKKGQYIAEWNHNPIISKVVIGKGITEIDGTDLVYITNLSEIVVDPENTTYIVEDGILYNKDKTSLVFYTNSKTNQSYTIPAGVKEIGYSAFRTNEHLKNLAIGTGVEKIARDALVCNLERIYYGGSEKEWNTLAEKVEKIEKVKIYYDYSVGEPGKVTGTAEKTANGYVITADVENVMGDCILLVAGYKNGKFVKMTYYNAATETILDADVDSIKIMAWENLSNLIPVAESLMLDIN